MNTVALRPNKPARYQMGNDGRTHLIEDEDQSTATPAIRSSDVFAAALDLLTAAAHATATEKRLAEIADARAKAGDTIAEAKPPRPSSLASIVSMKQLKSGMPTSSPLAIDRNHKNGRELFRVFSSDCVRGRFCDPTVNALIAYAHQRLSPRSRYSIGRLWFAHCLA